MAKKNNNNLEIFTIWSDEIESRLDPYFYRVYFRELEKELHDCKFTLAKLEDVCSAIRGVTYSNEDEVEEGLKILRANNITLATNELNFDDVRNIKADFAVTKEQQLKTGDILMSAASGSKAHVGKVAYIAEDLDFYFGSFMMVLRTNGKINPQYLFEFLSSKIFRGLLFRILGGTNINNLNFSMIKDFEIPLPSLAIQNKIAQTANKNREKAKELEKEARKIVASIDNFVLGELGIEIERERERERVAFAITSDEIKGRLDPFFYKPYFKTLQKAIESKNYSELGELVEFAKETWDQKSVFGDQFPYIEISNIDTSNGEIAKTDFVPVAEAPSRAKMVVREGDIIVSTTRPNRGAITPISKEQDGFIASTGFAILRDLKNSKVLKDYLFVALRTSLSLRQMEQRTTGGNYPAITTEDLRKIKIVVPEIKTQEKIVSGVKRIYNQARNLRQEAEIVISEAQKQTAEMIFA